MVVMWVHPKASRLADRMDHPKVEQMVSDLAAMLAVMRVVRWAAKSACQRAA